MSPLFSPIRKEKGTAPFSEIRAITTCNFKYFRDSSVVHSCELYNLRHCLLSSSDHTKIETKVPLGLDPPSLTQTSNPSVHSISRRNRTTQMTKDLYTDSTRTAYLRVD